MQPMTNEDGTLWLSFNGEIYNYIELRPELEARGHRFSSQSDTEVVWTLGPAPKGTCGAPADIASGVYGPYLQMGPVFWVMPRHRLQAVPHAEPQALPHAEPHAAPDADATPSSPRQMTPFQTVPHA